MHVSGDPAPHVEPLHGSFGWRSVLPVQQHQLLLGPSCSSLQHPLQLQEGVKVEVKGIRRGRGGESRGDNGEHKEGKKRGQKRRRRWGKIRSKQASLFVERNSYTKTIQSALQQHNIAKK